MKATLRHILTCVGRLICPEGRVSSLNKSNPTNSLWYSYSVFSMPESLMLWSTPLGSSSASFHSSICRSVHLNDQYAGRWPINPLTVRPSICLSRGVSWHFLENAWEEWPEIGHAGVSWPPPGLFRFWAQSVDFYPRPVLAFGYCHCQHQPVSVYVCPCVNPEFVQLITHSS